MNRRTALAVLGTTATAALAVPVARKQLGGIFVGESAAAAVAPACVVRPKQTEGPYFVDEHLHRSDIRSDPTDGSIKDGVTLRLRFHVADLRGSTCGPLAGATVDVWHCDALGVYSDVQDRLFGDTRGKKFLRGYQVTDASGTAEFLTIYPGWYQGRTVHVHFRVRIGSAPGIHHAFTSQLYFDDALTDRVHAQLPYARKGRRTVRNADDGIFRDGGTQLLLKAAEQGQGYAAAFELALQLA